MCQNNWVTCISQCYGCLTHGWLLCLWRSAILMINSVFCRLCVLLSDSVLDPSGQSCSRLLLSDLSLIRSKERFLCVRIAVRPMIDSFRRKIFVCTRCCKNYHIGSVTRNISVCTCCCPTYRIDFIRKCACVCVRACVYVSLCASVRAYVWMCSSGCMYL